MSNEYINLFEITLFWVAPRILEMQNRIFIYDVDEPKLTIVNLIFNISSLNIIKSIQF